MNKFEREIDRILDEANSMSMESEEYGKLIAKAINMQRVILENQKNENEKYRADVQWDSSCRELEFGKEKLEKELQIKEKELEMQKNANEQQQIANERNLKKDYIKMGCAMGGTIFLALVTVFAEETRVVGSKVGHICGGIVKFI